MEIKGLDQSVQCEQFGTSAEAIMENNELKDYSNFSKEELLEKLKVIIESENITKIKNDVDTIKVAFYKRHKSEIEEDKTSFLAQDGNKEEDYKLPIDDCETRLKELLSIYRGKRDDHNKAIELEHQKNFEAKQQVIENLKALVEKGDGDAAAFDSFKKLQKEWSSIGQIDKAKLNDIWKSYHLYVENFYNILKVNKELKDLDLKKNFEAKNSLCEQAESLILEPMVVEAFRKLQDIHDAWREIGPVNNELKEEQWNRFKSASVIINKKHQDYFEGIKQEQVANLNLKKELCDKVVIINSSDISTRKTWETATEQVIDIQKIWKTIGFAPKKENTRIYEAFKSLCNDFFNRKKDYFVAKKENYSKNISLKKEICEKIEEYKLSEDWSKATSAILELQKSWKEIGIIPKKESDELWGRFRKSCDEFFARKALHFSEMEKVYEENLTEKLSIIEELKSFTAETPEKALDLLKAIQNKWGKIGYVPIKTRDRVLNEYRDIINNLFKTYKGSMYEHKMEKFKSKVSSIKANKGSLNHDRERLINKIKQLEADVILLENNIGFFAKSKNAQAMINDVENKIKATKENVISLKEKVKIIDNQ
ncbi:MAG: DUF349 domain-containing protein [Bacteroidetes bacterium]|nr:DUF349 domain-containing protein [Bacteroidota bacterium]